MRGPILDGGEEGRGLVNPSHLAQPPGQVRTHTEQLYLLLAADGPCSPCEGGGARRGLPHARLYRREGQDGRRGVAQGRGMVMGGGDVSSHHKS